MGGKLSVSMGGADGVYVEAACSDDQMFALMDKLIQDAGTRNKLFNEFRVIRSYPVLDFYTHVIFLLLC
jgi:hypothetical protein